MRGTLWWLVPVGVCAVSLAFIAWTLSLKPSHYAAEVIACDRAVQEDVDRVDLKILADQRRWPATRSGAVRVVNRIHSFIHLCMYSDSLDPRRFR